MDLTRRKPEQGGHLESPQQPCDISTPRPEQDLSSASHHCKGSQHLCQQNVSGFHTPLVETRPAYGKLMLQTNSWNLKMWKRRDSLWEMAPWEMRAVYKNCKCSCTKAMCLRMRPATNTFQKYTWVHFWDNTQMASRLGLSCCWANNKPITVISQL